jgi:hypothetical protein
MCSFHQQNKSQLLKLSRTELIRREESHQLTGFISVVEECEGQASKESEGDGGNRTQDLWGHQRGTPTTMLAQDRWAIHRLAVKRWWRCVGGGDAGI